MSKTLDKVVKYSKGRIPLSDVSLGNYVTTDNLLQNKQGKVPADSLPPQGGSVTRYEKGDILVANIRPYLKKIWHAEYQGGSSADVLTLQVNEEHDSKFVFYCLFRDDFFIHVMNGAKGTKMPRGDKDQILDFIIPDFDKAEQIKIAKVLSDLDSKIELNNRINKELEAMAKLIYDYWFVQFGFPISAEQAANMGKPELEGKPYKFSGGKMVYNKQLKREIPEGWEAGKLSDFIQFNPSLSLPKGETASYIDMNAIPENGFMTKAVQDKEFNGGVKFQNGDVVVGRITPCLENGKTGLISLLGDDEIGFGSTEFIVMRGKNQPLVSFISCLSRSELFRKYAISKMTGTSGRKRVEYKMLELFPIAIPPNSLFEKFESLSSSYFDKMTIKC